MAIDQEIQRKVDAYRGNPQALQQRYAQNQQLIDLLALQKLKSEMDAAKRDMQMKMEQQPGTIKQQREQELLQRTKDDMVQQTQGVLQQRQAQQQQNMQRVAQGGLGALAPQLPPAPSPAQQIANQSQPVPRMAAGGIVAFQPGGAVEGEDRVTYQQWLTMSRAERERAGLPVSDIGGQLYFNRFGVGMGLNDPQTGERVRREPSPGSRVRAGLPPIETAPLIPRVVDTAGYDPASENAVPTRYNPASEDAVPTVYNPASEDAVPTVYNPASEDAQGGVAALTGEQSPPASSNNDGGATGLASLGVEVGGGSAEAAMERGFARADEYTNRAGVAERYAEMEARLAALDEEMYDPAEERRDQLKAFLVGTGGRGSTALAGGAAASMNMRSEQRAARRARLMEQFELAERGIGVDRDLANLGLSLGREMYAQVSANQRAALSAAASMRNADLQAEIQRARLDYDRIKDDREFGLRETEAEINRMDAETRDRNVSLGATTRMLDEIMNTQTRIIENLRENSNIPTLEMALTAARNEEDAAAIQAQIDAAENSIIIRTEEILNEMNALELRDRLQANLLELTGLDVTGSLSMEDVAGITGPGRE